MAPYLFINYRKKDTVALADSLYLMLQDALGDVIFKDNSILEKGHDFEPPIKQALEKATCMLVLIGEHWLFQYDDETGRRRLDMPDDWVRREIEQAFAKSIAVLPVVAPGAKIPSQAALPDSLHALRKRTPLYIRAESYIEDRHAVLNELLQHHGFRRLTQAQAGKATASAIPSGTTKRTGTWETQAMPISKKPKAWVNGTTLHYYFFDTTSGSADVVRQAIRQWKEVGIGLDFEEVKNAQEAEIRIGFVDGEGSWSYVGIDANNVAASERTMNFGWDLTSMGGLDTALHELGHVLGLSEEHRNPHSGIIWNEEAVYSELAGPPNYWSREQVWQTILSKGDPDNYYGPWDPDSIMHFPFGPGLIQEPAQYRDGLTPGSGLSAGDREKIRFLYPPITAHVEGQTVVPLQPVSLNMQPGEQANFTIVTDESRRYDFQTSGPAQVVMMLFEDRNGELTVVRADDNTGQERSAALHADISTKKQYKIRVRLFERGGDAVLMMW